MSRLPRALIALAGSVAGLAALRARMLDWGATPQEVAAAYPGEDLVEGARRGSVMAATIAAPPDRIWPWLVQMGCDRAGFYSWDRLDNGGRPSAERVHPEWQDLREGDRVEAVPDGSLWFDVVLLEPERTLVLRSSVRVPGTRRFDPRGPRPRMYSDGTWGFHLRPAGERSTRVVVAVSGTARPWWLLGTVNRLFWDPAHWVMQTRQFANLRRRAEGPAAVAPPGAPTRAAEGGVGA